MTKYLKIYVFLTVELSKSKNRTNAMSACTFFLATQSRFYAGQEKEF